ncbi:ABC transporter permease [Hyalangium versicolor]|uniref:ABC transporter permease n=1 Tax=Hyalangium versicolor TaxID=2861190 RepID=UPI001CCBDD5E|nr:ABC transporter permease [Hyalangium versicolor]
MRDFIQELRHALRTLARQPAFTAVAVLTLALGIAANTAIFSVVDAVLLSPLPYPQADRLVMAWSNWPNTPRNSVAPANYLDWREQNDVFEGLTAFQLLELNHSGEGTPERLRGASVSANFFQVLGVTARLGTTFQPSPDGSVPQQVVVLSHGLWQRHFGGDEHIIGRSVRLNDRSYEVIGVMPEGFSIPIITPTRILSVLPQELWVPAPIKDVPQLGPNADEDRSGWRDTNYLRVMGRLKPGVTLERAASAMSTIAERLAREYPQSNKDSGITLVPLREQLVGNVQVVLWVLLGAVGLVLAIACANVANLFLARASARRQEFAVRVALGAQRGRLMRQLLVESVLLSLGAGALGLLLALWGLDGLLALVPPELPRVGEIHLDGRVLAFTLCVSLGTGVLFGLVPALHFAAPDLSGVLRQSAGGKLTAARNRSRSVLVVGEVALAVVLLIGAGLLLRSLWRLQSVEPGFQADHVLTWKVALPAGKYPEQRQQAAFFEQLRERVASLPGVRSVGGISDLPLGGADIGTSVFLEGDGPDERRGAGHQVITPDYLRTLGIPLRAGRDVTATDTADAPQVMLVNETAARRFWPGRDPVGQRVQLGGQDQPWHTVVGLVGDVRHRGPTEQARPEVYVPAAQKTFFFMSFVARTEGEPTALVPALRSAVGALDSELPIADVRPMEQVLMTATARPRFVSLLVALFAGLSLLLAGVGLYGVIAYMARQRTQEIGIRMALGARPTDVLRLVVGQGMRLSLSGVGLGLLGAWATTRAMGSLLFEVSATDPVTFGALALLVMGVTLLATWLPAHRATRVDPLVALRSE